MCKLLSVSLARPTDFAMLVNLAFDRPRIGISETVFVSSSLSGGRGGISSPTMSFSEDCCRETRRTTSSIIEIMEELSGFKSKQTPNEMGN